MPEDQKSDVGEELSEFLGTVEPEAKVEDKSITEEVKVEEKSTSNVEESKPSTEVKVEPKQDVTAPLEEAEPQDDLGGMSDKELKTLVRSLRSKVDDAHGRLITSGADIRPDQRLDVGVSKKTETAIEQKVEKEVVNFMKNVNMDEIIDNPESLNKLLVEVYNKAITDAETRAVEKVLKSIPQLVVSYASRHASMSDLVRDFYNTNSDLVQVKRTVATVANEVAAEHPEWEVKNVFEEAATRTRKLLGIQKREKAAPSEKGSNPAFVKKHPGARRLGGDSSQLNDLQKEINDILV